MWQALQAMWSRLGDVSPLWALAALCVYVVSHLLTALRLRAVLAGLDRPVRLRDAFFANLTSIFVNNVMPGRVGGEVMRVALLHRRAGVDFARGGVAMGYDRLTDLVPLLLLVLLTLPTLRRLVPAGAGRTVALAFAIGLVLFAVLFAARLSRRVTSAIDRWRALFLRYRISRSGLVRASLLSLLLFAFDLARLILVALAFGVYLDPMQAAALSAVTLVGVLFPTPGGLGVVEGGLTGALVLFGVPLDQAMAITLLERGLSYGLGSAAGGIALLLLGGRELWRSVSRKPEASA